MLTRFLIHKLIRHPDRVTDPDVRSQYIALSGWTGIAVNLLLALMKGALGWFSRSVSVMGDAVNNLSDCATSLVSLVGARISSKPPDREHPFGHARAEYVVSTAIAAAILIVGYELGRQSVFKIIRPEPVDQSLVLTAGLCLSILAKLGLFSFNRTLGRRIGSSVLRAVATDSLTDALATGAVLIGLAVSAVTGYSVDGYAGLLVAGFVAYAALSIMKEMLDHMLGTMPSEQLTDQIAQVIRRYDQAAGWHDLMIHDYGPGRTYATAHIEVSAEATALDSHELIDSIERAVQAELGVQLVAHLDPIRVHDETVTRLYDLTKQIVSEHPACLDFHDFRVVQGADQLNLIFDVAVDPACNQPETELRTELQEAIRDACGAPIRVVLTVDRAYSALPVNSIRR